MYYDEIIDPEQFLEFLLQYRELELERFWFGYKYGIDWVPYRQFPVLRGDICTLYLMRADNDAALGDHLLQDWIHSYLDDYPERLDAYHEWLEHQDEAEDDDDEGR